MIKRFCVLIACVSSLSLRKELGTLYLTEEEPYELLLSDYFSGDNLSFSIADTNMTENSAKIQTQCDFDLLSATPYEKLGKYWSSLDAQTLIMSEDIKYQVILRFTQNYLAVYNFSMETQDARLIWNTTLLTEYQNPQIQTITILKTTYLEKNLILSVKQQQSDDLWRNDIYIIKTKDNHIFQDPKRASFNEIAYASKIVIGQGSLRKLLPIYCEFHKNSSIPNVLYIYEVNNIFEPLLLQSILKYEKIPSASNTLSIRSITTVLQYFYVLDSNYGIIAFYKAWPSELFQEGLNINLSYLGDLYSMENTNFGKMAVTTSSGIALVESNASQIGLKKFFKNKGKDIWIQIFEIQYYYFLQSARGILSVFPNSIENKMEILYKIDLKSLDPYGDRNIPGMLFNWNTNSYYYQRFDEDGLKSYKISLSEWKLKIIGGLFYVKIAAKDDNSNEISDALSVISISKKSYEIFALENGIPKLPESIDIQIDSKYAFAQITPSRYFSGPDLSYEFILPHSKSFEYQISTTEKLTVDKTLAPDGLQKFLINGSKFTYFYENSIHIEGMPTFNKTNPIKILNYYLSNCMLYSKPNENSFLISIYLPEDFTMNLVEEIESEIDCMFFNALIGWLLCGSNKEINIYNFQGYWKKVWSLSNVMNQFNLKFDIADAFFGDKTLILLLDKNLGFFVINIFDLQNEIKLEIRSQEIRKIVKLENKIGIIYDSKAEIYNHLYQYEKTVFFKTDRPITNAFSHHSTIFIQENTNFYAYDISKLSHDALLASFEVPNPGIISYGTNDQVEFLIANYNLNLKSIEVYKCFFLDSEYYTIHIAVSDLENLHALSYQESFSVVAYNDYVKMEISFPLNLKLDGSFPWIENENLILNKNFPYSKRFKIDLDDSVYGQNLELSLSINGINITEENQENFPVILPKTIDIVGEYNITNNRMKGHIIIPNTEIALIISESGFNFIDFNKEEKLLNISEHTHLKYLICYLIDTFPHTKQNLALIVTSCTHFPKDPLYIDTNDGSPLKSVMILWEIDYISLRITHCTLLSISAKPLQMKIAPLSENDFELMLIMDDSLTYNYKYILRFRGNWTENVIKIQLLETINFISLKIPSFFSIMLDYKVKNSQIAYWYIQDKDYGIRVLETNNSEKSIMVGGFPSENDNSYFRPIGVCEDTLFVSHSVDSIMSYKIKDYFGFEKESEYKIFKGPNNLYFETYESIICSKDKRYVAAHVYNANNYFLAIFDTKSKSSSNNIGTIYLSYPEHMPRILGTKFINENEISAIFYADSLYKRFKINERSLIFPKMNETEYNKMIEKWGSNNFSIIITAENANNRVYSSAIYFTREAEMQSNLLDINYWLVRFIILIAFLALFAGSVNFAKRIRSKHRVVQVSFEEKSMKIDLK